VISITAKASGPGSITLAPGLFVTDNRRRIPDMLAQGTLTAGEAEPLIIALERSSTGATSQTDKVKYPRVLVDAVDPHEGPAKVNVRVPIRLPRTAERRDPHPRA
jgi:hypothetical protein